MAEGAAARCVLSGPPGAGKSTVGPELARRLGWRFVDLDAVVEAGAGATVAEVFAREGEAGFRAREAAALRSSLAQERVVVAAGGGALVDRALRREVLRTARVVTLDAPAEVLRGRLAAGVARPLLRSASIEALLAARRAVYAEAHATVDASGAVAEVVAGVASLATSPLPLVMPLGAQSYRVHVAPLGGMREASLRPAVMVTDANVLRCCGAAVAGALHGRPATVTLKPGEGSKRLRSVTRIWSALAARGADRRDVVACVGGGVVTDLGGFAASTWLRGVPYVSVPTSLLAMVDASVGGKTGIDLPEGKNLVGAFHQPSMVWIDPAVLRTLPARHHRAALAEVVKVAAICDAEFLGWLEAHAASLRGRPDEEALRPGGVVENMVRRAVQAKIDVVAEDEREAGVRALLNLGHTVGHALEVGAAYRALHGDCVAVGMRAELALGEALGVTPGELRRRVVALMDALGLPRVIRSDAAAARGALRFDKKRENGALRLALVEAPGRGVVRAAPTSAVTSALRRVIEIR